MDDGRAEHLVDDLRASGVVRAVVADQRAVAHHEDPVGDGEHLGEPVGDEHARGATVAVFAQPIEEPFRLVTGERRCRLVEDQDPGLLVQRPGDHHQLLMGEVEAADASLGVDVDAELAEDRQR